MITKLYNYTAPLPRKKRTTDVETGYRRDKKDVTIRNAIFQAVRSEKKLDYRAAIHEGKTMATTESKDLTTVDGKLKAFDLLFFSIPVFFFADTGVI